MRGGSGGDRGSGRGCRGRVVFGLDFGAGGVVNVVAVVTLIMGRF